MKTLRVLVNREFRANLLKRLPLLALAAICIVELVSGVGYRMWTSSDNPKSVIAVQDSHSTLASSISSAAKKHDLALDVRGSSNGRQAVTSGAADAFVQADGHGTIKVLVKNSLSPKVSQTLEDAARREAITQQVTSLGGKPDETLAAVDAAHLDVKAVGTLRQAWSPQALAATAVLAFLVSAIMLAGQYVASGVVEERASCIAEILEVAVGARTLLAAKIIGNGLVGFIHLAVYAITGGVALLISGASPTLGIPLGTTLVWTMAWFVVGYITFITLWAVAATTAARPEDVGAVTGPVQMIIGSCLAVALILTLRAPDSTLSTTVSFLPGIAPFAMLCRIIFIGAPLWQILISLAISAVTCVALVRWGAWVYARSLRGEAINWNSLLRNKR